MCCSFAAGGHEPVSEQRSVQVADFMADTEMLHADMGAVARICDAQQWTVPDELTGFDRDSLTAQSEEMQTQLLDLEPHLLCGILRCMLQERSLDTLLATLPTMLHKPLIYAAAQSCGSGLHLLLSASSAAHGHSRGNALQLRMGHAGLLFAQLPLLQDPAMRVVSVDLSGNQLGNAVLATGIQVRFAAPCRHAMQQSIACVLPRDGLPPRNATVNSSGFTARCHNSPQMLHCHSHQVYELLKVMTADGARDFRRVLGVQVLATLTALRYLNLADNEGCHLAGLALAAAMPHWPALQYLNISQNPWRCKPAWLPSLQCLTALQTLVAPQIIDVTIETAAALCKLTAMEDLDLARVAVCSAALQQTLAAMPALQRLVIGWCGIADSGHASPVREPPAVALAPVAQCSALRSLELSAFVLDAQADHLRQLSALQHLSVDAQAWADASAAQNAFAGLSTLTLLTALHIHFHCTESALTQASQVATAVQCMPLLAELKLEGMWSDEAATIWQPVWAQLTTLTHLACPGNFTAPLLPLSPQRRTQPAQLSNVRALSLAVHDNNEDGQDGVWMEHAMHHFSNVTALWLSTRAAAENGALRVELQPASFTAIASQLTALQQLTLSQVNVSQCPSVAQLARLLPSLQELRVLDCLMDASMWLTFRPHGLTYLEIGDTEPQWSADYSLLSIWRHIIHSCSVHGLADLAVLGMQGVLRDRADASLVDVFAMELIQLLDRPGSKVRRVSLAPGGELCTRDVCSSEADSRIEEFNEKRAGTVVIVR